MFNKSELYVMVVIILAVATLLSITTMHTTLSNSDVYLLSQPYATLSNSAEIPSG